MYLSRLLNRPVRDSQGTAFARVHDLLIRPRVDEPYPPVDAVIVRLQRRDLFIPWQQIDRYEDDSVTLASARLSLEPFQQRQGELLLAEDILDRQLIDISGRRVVRAADAWLEVVDGRFRLLAVDVGFRALWSRIAPRWVRRPQTPGVLLDWAQVEAFTADATGVHLTVSRERLARLHPVDLARIVDQLSLPVGADLLEELDDETAADVLQEIDTERQVDLVEQMDAERVSGVIGAMDPDEAADLLGDLEPEQADAVLDEIEESDAEAAAEMRMLMTFEDDTAGGLMTTAYVAVPEAFTAEQAVAHFRTLDYTPEVIETVFITKGEDERLVGAVSLRDLLLAPLGSRVGDIAERDLATATPETSAEAAAQTMADYDLSALPVVDGDGCIVGVVTIDDAVDVIAPQQRRGRLPRVFR